MAKRPLTFELDQRAGVCVYRLAGNLYGNTGGYGFQDEVRQRFGSCKKVVIDFSNVERIDSCGVGILASIVVSAQNAEAFVVLASLPSHVEKVLGVTWLLECVDHTPTLDEALDVVAAR